MDKREQAKLRSLGFDTEAAVNRDNRLIMAITGKEKSGKTTFGLSAPKPIALFNFDRRIEKVALEVAGVEESDLNVKTIRWDEDQGQDEYMDMWNDFLKALKWSLYDSQDIRSIVVDTETDMWALIRLAYFGKTAEIMPWEYRKVNTPYRAVLNRFDESGKNVVLTRKLKKQYKNDHWNGKYEPAGMGEVKDVVQVNAEMYKDEGDIVFEILNNGLQASMNHETFTNNLCNFPMVAAMLTNTTPDEWE